MEYGINLLTTNVKYWYLGPTCKLLTQAFKACKASGLYQSASWGPGFSLLIHFLIKVSGKAAEGTPSTKVLPFIQGTQIQFLAWLLPHPVQVVTAIRGVNEQMEDSSLCLSVFWHLKKTSE